MHVYRIDAGAGCADGLFETAVYRFLELNSAIEPEGCVAIHTEICGASRQKSVRLWSDRAVEDFQRFWEAFQRERAQCAPF
jgi:hypothetical protein